MYGDFLLLEHTGASAQRAPRLPIGDTAGSNEAWLRDRLFEHPELVPIGDLDPAFGPLLPLCRELRTEAGPIDVTYINPAGRLTLVECKLWRNPEARRKVVAQILDYARSLCRWSYSDLQRQVAVALGRQGNVPFELAKSHNPALAEHQFVDAVTRGLRGGRFLLVVAGDGIREDIAGLAELINRNATQGFSFGLVELALYEFGQSGIAVQSRVPLRGHSFERQVMVLPNGEALIDLDQMNETRASPAAPDAPSDPAGKHARYREWWQPVIDMRFDDPDQEPPVLHWPNHVRVHLPWPKVWITAARVEAANGSCLVFLAGRDEERARLLALLEPVDELLAELPTGTALRSWASDGQKSFFTVRPKKSFATDDDRRAWLRTSVNQYVNALRARLKRLATERPS